MKSYLLKTFITVLFSSLVMYVYYVISSFHSLGFSWTGVYISIILFLYICYKFFYTVLWYKTIVITPLKTIWWFSVHLFILSCLFFVVNNIGASSGIVLFFKILFFLSIPFILFLVFYSFWKKILSYYQSFSSESQIFQFLISIWFGFFCFSFVLTLCAFMWLYNYITVLFILISFAWFWFKQILEACRFLYTYKINFKNHDFSSKKISENINPFLLSTEFLFIIVTGLISINFISVFRPFPIGWDDLGVYMNYPKLLAQAWEMLPLGQMLPWQLFTWIWFLFESQTLAFFINSFSWVLAGVWIYLFLYSLITQNTEKKTYINIPLLWATIFLAMPMVIFQIAKDMKLDVALLFVSLISLYILYYVSFKKDISFRKNALYIFIAGILAGFCFSIKVTSLLFVLWSIWLLVFSHLSIAGFLWYIWIFFAVFTKLWLWSLMNVVYPKDNPEFINYFSIVSLLVWIWFILYSFFPKKIDISISLFQKLAVFILGICIALSPWVIKNIAELGVSNVPVARMIWWKIERFTPDYTQIYTTDELDLMEKTEVWRKVNSSGTTSNEDFGRYFWYETGINNYIKLPWNLTMQLNQKWDFTDITYIFLALIPVLLLFLPYRIKYVSYAIVWVVLLEICLFLNLPSQELFTNIFATLNLPGWYIAILWIFLIPLFFFVHTLKKDSYLNKLFLLNLSFTILYVFLWNISAFWVVWYGIVMYLSFILMISIGLYFVSAYSSKKEDIATFFASMIIFIIISFYFIFSSIPHMMWNLSQASYAGYKLGAINENESIFASHPDYLPILFELNFSEWEKQKIYEEYQRKIQEMLSDNNASQRILWVFSGISTLPWLWEFLRSIESAPNTDTEIFTLKKESKAINKELTKTIIYPTKEQNNEVGIYRIGTFLKYFISENYNRLLEDSLVEKFDTYIYDQDPNVSVQRMKDLGLWYLLVDLNAATIDRDPRHDLTRRYENLLKTFTSDNLELIETDSICLKVALEGYSKNNDIDQYMMLASTNHQSYSESWVITRSQKMVSCYRYILDLMKNDKIDQDNYSYLVWLDAQFKRNEIDINNEKEAMWFLQKFITSWFKVLFKIQ